MNMFPEGVTEWFLAAAAVPNILFALSYQMNFFPVFKGMQNATDKRFNRSVFAAITFSAISYLMIGILGYDLYGNNIEPNFLQNILYNTD